MAVILSCYFLGLTLVPCEDEMISTENDTEFHELSEMDHAGSHADDCSPFCQCHCCHVHITNFQDSETELVTLEISTKISDKKNDLGKDIIQSFFQPPRV